MIVYYFAVMIPYLPTRAYVAMQYYLHVRMVQNVQWSISNYDQNNSCVYMSSAISCFCTLFIHTSCIVTYFVPRKTSVYGSTICYDKTGQVDIFLSVLLGTVLISHLSFALQCYLLFNMCFRRKLMHVVMTL